MSEANSNPIVSLKSSSRLLATAKNLRPGLMTIRPDLKRLAAQMQPPDLAPIRTKLATSFDQYFKDKSPAQAQTIRDELILEARQRYNADQTLLAKIEKLINDEARARGVVADPGPVARPCNAGFVWRLAMRPTTSVSYRSHTSACSRKTPRPHPGAIRRAARTGRTPALLGSSGAKLMKAMSSVSHRRSANSSRKKMRPIASRSTDPGQLLRPERRDRSPQSRGAH